MKVALHLDTLNGPNTVKLGHAIFAGMTGNALFTPNPPLAQLTGLLAAVSTAETNVSAAEVALRDAVNAKNTAYTNLRAGLTDEAATVEAAVNLLPAAQQLAAIESAGMTAQSAKTRLTSLGAVEGLSLSAGDNPGTMDWHCDPVARKEFYMVESTVGPVTAASNWVTSAPATASKGTITGLASGTSVSVRVHAAGTHGIVGPAAVAGPKIVP